MDFDWDEGNRDKNLRHGVQDWEIEEVFEDTRRKSERAPSVDGEERFFLLARVKSSGRLLRIVYTERTADGVTWIRPISAMDLRSEDRRKYRRRK